MRQDAIEARTQLCIEARLFEKALHQRRSVHVGLPVHEPVAEERRSRAGDGHVGGDMAKHYKLFAEVLEFDPALARRQDGQRRIKWTTRPS